MSRPRRFGKSLLVSTISEIFKGNRELFKECFIYDSDYTWKEHPVVQFDFSRLCHKTTDELEMSLREMLDRIARHSKVELRGEALLSRLTSLVETLSEKEQVCLLIDEYDRPIIDHLDDLPTADGNRKLLKSFFSTLKSLDRCLAFTFVTGISKFSQVSLFSGFNNLRDITIDPAYCDMLGLTSRELDTYFSEHIDAIVKQKPDMTVDEVMKEMKEWYNGYSFSKVGPAVYNPFSTLNYLMTGEAETYWFSSGMPSFLMDLAKRSPQTVPTFSGMYATAGEILNLCDLANLDLKGIMWQTGYLTFKAYDEKRNLYALDFPNKEVRVAFFESLVQSFSRLPPSDLALRAHQMRDYLNTADLESFFKLMNIYFAKMSYHIFSKTTEAVFHALFVGMLEGMGIISRIEETTNLGRIDLVTDLPDTTCLFEFKLDSDADVALAQIEEKDYKHKFCQSERNILVIGVNFCSEKRQITDWKAKLFSSSGKLLKDLLQKTPSKV